MGGREGPARRTRRAFTAGLTASVLAAPSLARTQPPPALPPSDGSIPALPAIDPDSVLDAAADRANRMTVPVLVNGLGPFPFVIDTGSNRTVVSDVLASRLNLPVATALQVRTATGVASTGSVQIASLAVGKRRMTRLRAPVLEARHLGALGMLGIDAVSDQRIVMDFRRNQMSLAPTQRRDDDPDALVVRARSKYGQLLLVDAWTGSVPLYVILDTGGETTIGNLALRTLLARRRAEEAQQVQVISVTGDTALADLTLLPEVRIGHVLVRNQQIAYADMYAFEAFGLKKKPSMLLGMSTLRHFGKVSIDFPAREARFVLAD